MPCKSMICIFYRDAVRAVTNDRNVYGASMLMQGDADAMVTGVTRNSFDALDEISRVIAVEPGSVLFGLTVLLARERTVLLADHSKVGNDCMARFGGLTDVDLFITDTGLDEETAGEFGDAGVRVIRT